MKSKVSITSTGEVVEIRLSEAAIKHTFNGDVVADVNRAGNWIRGVEVLGSGLQFSLERALRSLKPERSAKGLEPPPSTLFVTYDEDANAGFLYLPYASSASIERELQSTPELLKVSYSVEDDSACFGLAGDDTLVSIRFKVPATETPEKFVRLFRADS